MQYSIVTVPRTGGHYLQERISQHTNVEIPRHHEIQNNKMITMARDPIDFLTSSVAMGYVNPTKENIVGLINRYEYVYESVLDAYVAINYDDLTLYPYQTIKSLAKLLNFNVITESYESKLVDQPQYKHLVSSKKLKNYEIIKQDVSQQNLDKIYKIHNKMLSKCIAI